MQSSSLQNLSEYSKCYGYHDSLSGRLSKQGFSHSSNTCTISSCSTSGQQFPGRTFSDMCPRKFYFPVICLYPISQYAHKFHFLIKPMSLSFYSHLSAHLSDALVSLSWRQYGIIKRKLNLKSWPQHFLPEEPCALVSITKQRGKPNPLRHRIVVCSQSCATNDLSVYSGGLIQ